MEIHTVMYHSVRRHDRYLPASRYLHIDDFRAQLAWLGHEFGLLSREKFLGSMLAGGAARGAVLTFDDGLSDHALHVLPLLREQSAWGIFYVSSAPYVSGRLLDVHRIHVVLARSEAREVAASLIDMLRALHLMDQVETAIAGLSAHTYVHQSEDEAVLFIKRALNYVVPMPARREIIETLTRRYIPDEASLAHRYYMTPHQLKRMHDDGMLIGAHGVNHYLMSGLSAAEQRDEIESSLAFIADLLGADDVRTFCYPYGGTGSYDEITKAILNEAGCQFCFCVEPRPIVQTDIELRPLTLPRFDCNQFPHGSVSGGERHDRHGC